MTKNQIEYWRNVETKRSNLATELETKRSNEARELETRRHNLVVEQQGFSTLAEQARSNQAREYETSRSNLENERIRRDSQATERAQLSEVIAHNRASEANNLLAITTQARTAANQLTADVAYRNVTTLETQRANIARENETQRANLMSEVQRRQQLLQSDTKLAADIQNYNKSLQQQKVSTFASLFGNLANTLGRILAKK